MLALIEPLARRLQWTAMSQRLDRDGCFPGWPKQPPPSEELLWRYVGPEQQALMREQARAALAFVVANLKGPVA